MGRGEGLAKRLLASRELFVAVAAPVPGRIVPPLGLGAVDIKIAHGGVGPGFWPMPLPSRLLLSISATCADCPASLSPVNLNNSAISSACRSWRLDHPGNERLHTRVGLGIIRRLRCPFLRAPQLRRFRLVAATIAGLRAPCGRGLRSSLAGVGRSSAGGGALHRPCSACANNGRHRERDRLPLSWRSLRPVHIGDNAAHVDSPGDQPIQPRSVCIRQVGPALTRATTSSQAAQRHSCDPATQAPPTSNTNGG